MMSSYGVISLKVSPLNFWFHCMEGIQLFFSAGVGRTGTYIAIDSLLEQAKQEDEVDVFGFTALMRSNRVNMIQTAVSVWTFDLRCTPWCTRGT